MTKSRRANPARAGPIFAAMLFAAATFAIPYGGGATNPLGSPTPIGVAIMANTIRPSPKGEMSKIRTKHGPIPLDNFGNDPSPNHTLKGVDKSPGSMYDRLKKRIEAREAKTKK